MPDNEESRNQSLPLLFHGLSYEVHTNRELEFMLKGIKPLAWFSDMIFDGVDMWEPDEEFERQVDLGAFMKHEIRELWEPFASNGHLVKGKWQRFYALKDEAWRIPAFILLKRLTDKHPWSDALERLEGSLLGYTDEQNDEWLAKRQTHSAGWQCITLYALTTDEVLSEISELGNRAFPKGCLQSLRLFTAESIPDRDALEKSDLFKGVSCCKLIRFGVHWHFLKDCLSHAPRAGLSPASVLPGTEAKDLNKALRTDIQVFDVR